MKRISIWLGILLTLIGCQSANNGQNIDNTTVPALDIPRFMGKWYEIARYEHRFEKGMTHVSVTYSLLDNGKIRVVNEEEKDGKHKQVTGRAKQPNPQDPGKLKVSFFLWFYSDYYILDLAPDYSYVLVKTGLRHKPSDICKARLTRLPPRQKDRRHLWIYGFFFLLLHARFDVEQRLNKKSDLISDEETYHCQLHAGCILPYGFSSQNG